MEPNAGSKRLVPEKTAVEGEKSMQAEAMPDLVAAISANLPYLRRYARALTGSQTTGDRFAAATLEALLEDMSALPEAAEPRVGLFHVFHVVWSSAGAPVGEADTRFSAVAQAHMAGLTPNTREALLLQVIEGFSPFEIAQIMQTDLNHVHILIDTAVREMQASVTGRVMIIEDEAIISMDIAAIVREMGHDVTGIAATRSEAIELAKRHQPDLILADIQLADRSSGIDAVNDILKMVPDVPVIFITAFPERLLTGERPEPAFLITKPYAEEQVRSAVSQAMFFSSTETLHA
jgi:DNA-directed RNA polymerase specialized sigma24 family protein